MNLYKMTKAYSFSSIIIVLIFSLILGCTSQDKRGNMNHEKGVETPLKYAKGFKLEQFKSHMKITILNPNDTAQVLTRFKLFPESYQGKLKENEIKVPCKKIICLSSTQLAYFLELGATDNITALNSSRHLFNKEVNRRLKEGSLKQVGKEGNFNVELIAGINPDLILVSPFKVGGYDAIKNLGIPLLPIAAYKEETPLGRSEWVKMISSLIGMETEADSVFNHIESEYNRYKHMASTIKERPSVFSGKMKAGNWYVPGGDSFIAHLLRDAGADYIIKDKNKGAYPLDFEAVYEKAHRTEFWRLQVSSSAPYRSQSLKTEDERYADFDAYKKGRILVCNIQEKPYYEENPIKPHVILADYIHLFHPELLPDYKPVYYELLK